MWSFRVLILFWTNAPENNEIIKNSKRKNMLIVDNREHFSRIICVRFFFPAFEKKKSYISLRILFLTVVYEFVVACCAAAGEP